MNKKFFTLLLISALPLIGLWAFMDLPKETAIGLLKGGSNWIIATLLVFIFVAVLRMFAYLNSLQELILNQNAAEAGLEDAEVAKPVNWWSKFYERLTDAVPVENEESIATDHNYDGIIELDNNLPPWWKAGFYLGIVFAVVYLLRFHVFKLEPLSGEEYVQQMEQAEVDVKAYLATAKDLVDENNVIALTEASRLSSGADIFKTNCAVCHAADGGGLVGPNLTDAYWLHGGSIKDVFTTVKYGVPTKGMIAWKDNLRASEIQEVASYIMTLVGTTPVKAKEPEGILFEPKLEDALESTPSAE
jgi:cytochrome c oxidase cbb3-type subunit 3